MLFDSLIDYTFWNVCALIGVGLLAGFINTIAGSGSMVSLPFLIFLGLPADVANGTNRIGILLQSLVGVSSFAKHKKIKAKTDFWLAIPAVIGAIIGARFAVVVNAEILEKIIGGLMLLMLFVVLLKPKKWLEAQGDSIKGKRIWLQVLLFLSIGFYGGFIQAGVGIFLLSALVLGAGLDLIRANGVKLLIIFIFTPFALYVFFINGQVDILAGLILAVGNMAGAFIAAHLAIKKGAGIVRWVLLFVLLGGALKLLLFP